MSVAQHYAAGNQMPLAELGEAFVIGERRAKHEYCRKN